MVRLRSVLLPLLCAVCVSHSAYAAQCNPDGSADSSAPDSVKAYCDDFAKMHREMNIVYRDDADVDFVLGMIPHHQGAVDMAETVLKYGSDPDIRALAEWIIFAQEIEIADMRHWAYVRGYLDCPDCSADTYADHAGAMQHAKISNSKATKEYVAAMHAMHAEMNIHFTGDADVDFVKGMIPHHQAAIEMARSLVRHGQNPELQELARAIITSQKNEIWRMRRWLENHSH